MPGPPTVQSPVKQAVAAPASGWLWEPPRGGRVAFLPPGDLGRVRQAARFLRGFGGGEVQRAERASLPAETPTARAGLAARRLPTNLQSPAKDLDDYDEMQSEGPTHLQSQAEAARASSAGCPGAQRIDLRCCDAGLRPLGAGSPGMQHISAASCQQSSVEGLRTSSAGCPGVQDRKSVV